MHPIAIDPAAPFFIVLNAGSGHDDAAVARATIEQVMTEGGRECHLRLIEQPSQLREIARETVEHARARKGVVVVAGGDGTINTVANATYGSGCPFGVIPQGTFNYFGRTHGIPLEVADATRVLLASHAHPVQVGMVNERIFLVNASLGLYPQLLEDREAYKQRWGRSRLVALLAALVTLTHAHRQLRLDVEAEGRTRGLRTPTLFVGNNRLQLEQIGMAEAHVIEHRKLVALAAQPISTLGLLKLFVRGAFGKLGDADDVISLAVERIAVKPRRSERQMKVAADGEIMWLDAPIEFKVAPEPLYLIKRQPAGEA